MKHRIAVALAGLLVISLAGAAQAQQKPGAPRARGEMGRPGRPGAATPGMVAHLIAIRSELKLTDAQVGRLTDIQKRYQDRNAPLVQRLRSARPDSAMRRGWTRDSVQKLTPEQRTEMRRRMQDDRQAYLKAHPEVRDAQKQLRDNTVAMRKEVNDVLTSEQRTLLRQHMGARPRMGRRPGRQS